MQYHKRLQHSSATHNLPLCRIGLYPVVAQTGEFLIRGQDNL